jgi:hypothetical protein
MMILRPMNGVSVVEEDKEQIKEEKEEGQLGKEDKSRITNFN